MRREKTCRLKQQEEVEGLTRALREANTKIRQLEQQIENMDDYTEEVYALRNYVYREEKTDNNAPSLNTMNEYIRSMKIIIIGGSLNWQQKLKEVFPTIEFFEVDEKNRDISKIKRVDAVFINTTIFAHSFYKKIMKELSKKETPLFYLGGQNNIEKTTLEIYQWLTE
ncbi:hypothetical protein [Bacillus sp. X1(2014)]|uniref:hypothetical protein n=1 Tax=Bacillus sp. X1(2014) TaxID=1565991 RepID=UPI0011A9870C|nr:hypothetical protein [Bacillus sp. X1(2014)]